MTASRLPARKHWTSSSEPVLANGTLPHPFLHCIALLCVLLMIPGPKIYLERRGGTRRDAPAQEVRYALRAYAMVSSMVEGFSPL